MSWTKVREKIVAILTIAFIILMIGAILAWNGFNIPVISRLLDSLN